ncbi:helix-turn-helix domain-containing protein [Planktotalea frisia]|nr:helix-turn-helix domain-containing protein [Planktotalea frisia]
MIPGGDTDLKYLLTRFDTLKRPDVVFLCCGFDVHPDLREDARRLIRACKRNGVRIISIGAATWVMAEEHAIAAGKCVMHWASEAAFSERHLSLSVSNNLFDTTGNVSTCAGELATLDFMIYFMSSEFGEDIARRFCDKALVAFPRQATSIQPGALENRLRHYPARIQNVVRQMSKNIETPLSLSEIAVTHQISQRQLERLFSKHLRSSPRKYYLGLQLEIAYELIEQTSISIAEISIASGFGSPSLLSRHFKVKYGLAPTMLRRNVSMFRLQV